MADRLQHSSRCLALMAAVWSCGGSGGSADVTGTTSDPASDPTSSDQGSEEMPGSSDGSGSVDADSGVLPTGGESSDVTAGSESETGGASGSGQPSSPSGLPETTGPCPALVDGEVVFAPAGVEPRVARVWIDEVAQTQDGPLVFYWHGTGSTPSEATFGLTEDNIEAVTAQGGLVIAFEHDPEAGRWPWFLIESTRTDDLALADEALACVVDQVGVDTSRIHAMGMSAGALQTTAMSFLRSSYLASVSTFSGGLIGAAKPGFEVPTFQEPDNKLAALVFHGGPDDVRVISFQEASEAYVEVLRNAGHFAALCDHGNGHAFPAAKRHVLQFFEDHPYGTTPSPYAEGLPAVFPSYCRI